MCVATHCTQTRLPPPTPGPNTLLQPGMSYGKQSTALALAALKNDLVLPLRVLLQSILHTMRHVDAGRADIMA